LRLATTCRSVGGRNLRGSR